MTHEPAANDSGAEIAAGLALVVRCHRGRLASIGRFVRQVAVTEGAIVAICGAVAVGALAVAAAREEPMRSVMRTCAGLNVLTVALCLRSAFRMIRDALQEARDVRALLRDAEAALAAFEASRAGAPAKTLPAERLQGAH